MKGKEKKSVSGKDNPTIILDHHFGPSSSYNSLVGIIDYCH